MFSEVLLHIDHRIQKGHRGQAEQDRAYRDGFSKVRWPFGNHNRLPSTALDATPWPWDYQKPDLKKLNYFAAFALGVASQLKVPLRWGGDWDRNHDFNPPKAFNDLYHFELVLY